MVPYGRQNIDEADIEAVISVLRSDFLTQGPAVPAFERAVAEYCGAAHAIAVNSATSALHLACLALGVGPGDRIWTSPITFVASANCALYCGAEVDFVDIDPHTFNMCPSALEHALEQAKQDDRLPKVIIPVHMCGQSCDMATIKALADRFGIRVIEDASHAIGGRYRNTAIGHCDYSDITIFSFHPVKIITSGEGGMAVTQDKTLGEAMRLLRSHGVTRDPGLLTAPAHGSWYYEQLELGFNYRLTDIHAALGLSQMRRLDEFVTERHRIADRYDRLLEGLPLAKPGRNMEALSTWHLYVIRLDTKAVNHRAVFEGMKANGIGVNLHYMPVYLQPYYAKRGFLPGKCPEAERYYSGAMTIPIYPSLTNDLQDKVVMTLRDCIRESGAS